MSAATVQRTTPTGIPFINCGTCGKEHPETRRHCKECGIPSVFISPGLLCLGCREAQPIPSAERAADRPEYREEQWP